MIISQVSNIPVSVPRKGVEDRPYLFVLVYLEFSYFIVALSTGKRTQNLSSSLFLYIFHSLVCEWEFIHFF